MTATRDEIKINDEQKSVALLPASLSYNYIPGELNDVIETYCGRILMPCFVNTNFIARDILTYRLLPILLDGVTANSLLQLNRTSYLFFQPGLYQRKLFRAAHSILDYPNPDILFRYCNDFPVWLDAKISLIWIVGIGLIQDSLLGCDRQVLNTGIDYINLKREALGSRTLDRSLNSGNIPLKGLGSAFYVNTRGVSMVRPYDWQYWGEKPAFTILLSRKNANIAKLIDIPQRKNCLVM